MHSFTKLNCFILIVGNARSGSTLLGSIIDAHPNAIVANETSASTIFWRGLNRHDILEEIFMNSKAYHVSGRMSEGYNYSIQQKIFEKFDIYVMGDKVWNPATLLLHGDYSLLKRLEELLEVPIKIIHSIRNPFDVIATMHMRSRAPIPDRILWYFMHCDAVCAIRDHCCNSKFIDVHHDKLILSPDNTISDLCEFIGIDSKPEHIESCKNLLFNKPKKTRFNLKWDKKDKKDILNRISKYAFLEEYAIEDYSDLPINI